MGADVDELDCLGNRMAKTVLVTSPVRNECIEDELLDVGGYISLYLGWVPVVGQVLGVYPYLARWCVGGG